MSDPTMKVVGELQGNSLSRLCTRTGFLALSLGLSASVVASPTVKRDSAAGSGNRPIPAEKRHWFQIGKASWYGPGFHGRTTANGETYDMYAYTCAHRTLPLGTWIRVTNLHNKRSVFLRVNDRGPVATNLIADLSFAAAQRLSFDGLAKVKIELVSPTDPELAKQLVNQLPMSNDPMVLYPESSEPTLGLASVVADR